MRKLTKPANYDNLLRRVRAALVEGQRRIEAERIKTYWEAGRIIHAEILKHKDRAEYGAEIFKRLADDLQVNQRVLERCVQFAKTYPRLPITATGPQFKWSHYRQLMTVTDGKLRLSLEKGVAENDWSVEELAARLKEVHSSDEESLLRPKLKADSRELITPLRGQLYTYQIVERPTIGEGESGLLVDLGFGTFHEVDSRQLAQFSKGDIVESRPKEDAYKFTKGTRTPKDLYTYAAYVERVIDADTLKVRIDLGFNVWSRHTLRLRGIDCPEISTKEGQAAKAFVQSHIKEADRIIIRSSRSDKYDRYLADLFIPQGEGKEDIFLNNLLLETGHAVRWE